jgi:hypothetical protein
MISQHRAVRTIRRAVLFPCALGLLAVLDAGLFEPAAAQAQSPCPAGAAVSADVTTYHNDSQRTGWNPRETILKPCNVNQQSFGLLTDNIVRLDSQVDAQPLVVTNQEVQTSGGRQRYDVVIYVATEANTVYAIDGLAGKVLTQRTLGIPVPESKLPDCGNNAPTVGITSTPVIDREAGTIFVIAYLLEDDKPVYRIFALDLADLSPKVKPGRLISASHDLVEGKKYEFNASVSRQRAGLLLANGNVYAGFGSFCDHQADVSRGWVLGWDAKSLTPLPMNQLHDRRLETNSLHEGDPPGNFFLASVWMSGYGIATADDHSGDIYFITGNSDEKGPYQVDPKVNLQESVVRMRGDLSAIVDYFTPSDSRYGLKRLEGADLDFGAGGVFIVPKDQVGPVKHLAVAAGKIGQMYLLDRDSLGKYDPSGTNHVLDAVDIGKCWCGQSYFVGSDGIGRAVSSGDPRIKVWKIVTSPSPKFVPDYSPSVDLHAGGFQKGLFTSISSDGQTAGSAIIWAVRRPTDDTTYALTLYAFDAADGKLLYSGSAGTWRWYQQAAANVVPTVANGRVYVASNGELRIFGPTGQQAVASASVPAQLSAKSIQNAQPSGAAPPALGGSYSGSIIRVEGAKVWLNTPENRILQVDTSKARKAGRSVHLEPGQPVTVRGSVVGDVIEATSVFYGLAR